ncbi:hypothetical protein D3C86_1450530 [compost metagenome]
MEFQEDHIDSAIEALSRQIELLSRRCSLEDNRNEKNYKFQELLEASSIMLQLSRTLNELIMTKHMVKNSVGNENNINSMINTILGGRKN